MVESLNEVLSEAVPQILQNPVKKHLKGRQMHPPGNLAAGQAEFLAQDRVERITRLDIDKLGKPYFKYLLLFYYILPPVREFKRAVYSPLHGNIPVKNQVVHRLFQYLIIKVFQRSERRSILKIELLYFLALFSP